MISRAFDVFIVLLVLGSMSACIMTITFDFDGPIRVETKKDK